MDFRRRRRTRRSRQTGRGLLNISLGRRHLLRADAPLHRERVAPSNHTAHLFGGGYYRKGAWARSPCALSCRRSLAAGDNFVKKMTHLVVAIDFCPRTIKDRKSVV